MSFHLATFTFYHFSSLPFIFLPLLVYPNIWSLDVLRSYKALQ